MTEAETPSPKEHTPTMPLLDVDEARGTFSHQCAICGLVRSGLRLDPGTAHATPGTCTPACWVSETADPEADDDDEENAATVSRLHPDHGDLHIAEECLVTRECPGCRARGLSTIEAFHRRLLPWDAHESPHPDSLVGQTSPDGRFRVVEHHIAGTERTAEGVQQAQLIRAMQRHPHLAPHAPPHEYVLLGRSLKKLARTLTRADPPTVATPVTPAMPTKS